MLEQVDLTDPMTFRNGPPLDVFAALRHSAPVWWQEASATRPGFWVVSRYEDIQRILALPTLFINAKGITVEPTEPAGLEASAPERGQSALSYTDPPEHRELRKRLARHFTPGRVRQLEPQLTAEAARLVADLVAAGGGDFITEVADRYPLMVLSHILDLPATTTSALGAFVVAVAARLPGVVDDPRSTQARRDFLAAIDELAEFRKRQPGEDLISALVTVGGGAAPLIAQRLGGILIQLAIAGNDTTRAALGHGAWLLAEHQGAQEAFRDQPNLGPGVVEEILRYRPPVIYVRRTAAQPSRIGDGAFAQEVAAGDAIYLSVASGNRDERVFASPDSFDVQRFAGKPAHLSLGFAEHHCLGAATARTELRCLFGALISTTRRFALFGVPTRESQNVFIDGVAHLPIIAEG